MKSLISPAEALNRILENLPPDQTIRCPLTKCSGRILKESVTADRPFPPFDRSMMDGYAIHTEQIDSSGVFEITSQAHAGSPEQCLGSKQRACMEIMTGAVVPSDANCVVQYEATRRIDGKHMQLLDTSDPTAGDFIHSIASDRTAGEILLHAGTLIGSREIAVAASCGCDTLLVSKMPTIAIVSTGDELVDIATAPQPHQIRRSNDIMIDAALKQVHMPATQFAHLPDEPEASTKRLSELIATNDIVLISGGISMGKKDFVPTALDALGLGCQFHGVAQKPGKPLGYWSQPNCAVFALPGNPLSTLTCLHQYVIPALFNALALKGNSVLQKVHLASPVKARDDLTIFLPVSLNENNQATAQPTNNSGDLVRICKSDGYIALPPNKEKGYKTGKSFDFHPWY